VEAAGEKTPGAGHNVQLPAADTTRARCPSVLKALDHYTQRYLYWTEKRAGAPKLATHGRSKCPRYLLGVRRAKAANAHRAYDRWYAHEWNWQSWLPDKFARVGACETGYGKKPGSWTWDSGTYVSAFGIYRPAYAQFARITGTPTWDEPGARTPREQYTVASAIQARFGWGAWGCSGA